MYSVGQRKSSDIVDIVGSIKTRCDFTEFAFNFLVLRDLMCLAKAHFRSDLSQDEIARFETQRKVYVSVTFQIVGNAQTNNASLLCLYLNLLHVSFM